MLLFLLACDPEPPDTGSGGEDTEETADSGGGETGDSGGRGPSEIASGPTCAGEPLPMETPFNVGVGHVVEGTATDTELADLERLVVEWSPGVSGPWSHEVRGPYTVAADLSVTGGGTALVAASVGDVVQTDDGGFVMVYVDGDLDGMLTQAHAREPFRTGLRGLGGLSAATSEDGVVWTRTELTVDAPWPAYSVDPELTSRPGGGFAIYFYGVPPEELCADVPDPFMVPGAHRMYRATSEDLLHWSGAKEVWSNPDGGTDPAVWCISEASCYGWFRGGISSSDGGETWSASAAVLVDVEPMLPDVVQVGDGWRMFLLASEGIVSAWSEDGQRFESEGPLGLAAASPSAVVAGGTMGLYLSGPASP